MVKDFITKCGEPLETRTSGMVRAVKTGKARFDLVIPTGQKYNETMLYRLAALLARGAEIHGERNWEKANTREELEEFKACTFRHFIQWYCGEKDEDHAAAIWFGMNSYEFIKGKIEEREARIAEGGDCCGEN